MKIKPEGKIKINRLNILKHYYICCFFKEIQKFVYLVQYALAWHIEQVYEFTMKVRTSKFVFDHFSNKFQNYNFEEDDVKKKVKLLVDFIKETKYVSFLCFSSLIAHLIFFLFIIVETRWL
jgi:hypothetical protein